jgi:hypothetical protein
MTPDYEDVAAFFKEGKCPDRVSCSRDRPEYLPRQHIKATDRTVSMACCQVFPRCPGKGGYRRVVAEQRETDRPGFPSYADKVSFPVPGKDILATDGEDRTADGMRRIVKSPYRLTGEGGCMQCAPVAPG